MYASIRMLAIGMVLSTTSLRAPARDLPDKCLASPVPVMANGRPIEVGGFPAPFVGDFDGDRVNDLLIGQFDQGRLRIYRNNGTNAQPRFSSFTWFTADGRIAAVPNCCQAAFTPQLIDFDRDGRTDILTGSGTGKVFLFRHHSDGSFAAAEILENQDGQVYLHRYGTGGQARRFNVTATAYDWDADGDLDLLLGRGPLCLVANEGSVKYPRFDGGRVVQCDGKGISCAFGAPQIADWDGDQLDDLIVGSAEGIVWYRNIGRRGAPEFSAPALLIPARERFSSHDVPHDRPGFFHAFCVVDFNGDGRLDLLVGDRFRRNVELSAAERQRILANRQRRDELREKYYQLRIAHPQDETRASRVQRYQALLRSWQDAEALRDNGYISQGRRYERRGCVWYYERIERHPTP